MSLKTRASFLYDLDLRSDQIRLDLQEGANPPVIAVLTPGNYTLIERASAFEAALNSAGSLTYTVTISRVTRLTTITATGVFSLLIQSGPNSASGVYFRYGFGTLDLTGASTYTGVSPVGKVYEPQFFLLDYVDSNLNQSALLASVNETAGGRFEVIKFGVKYNMECTIDFITDMKMPLDSYIDYRENGLALALDFMEKITDKKIVEFMKDKTDVTSFEPMILESNASSRDGVGFRIRDKTSDGFDGFYTTGLLEFRRIET